MDAYQCRVENCIGKKFYPGSLIKRPSITSSTVALVLQRLAVVANVTLRKLQAEVLPDPVASFGLLQWSIAFCSALAQR